MKKSEMVKKLVDYYNLNLADPVKLSNRDAEDLLDFLVYEGMLPPEYQYWNSNNPNDVDEKGIPKHLVIDRMNGTNLLEWEPG